MIRRLAAVGIMVAVAVVGLADCGGSHPGVGGDAGRREPHARTSESSGPVVTAPLPGAGSVGAPTGVRADRPSVPPPDPAPAATAGTTESRGSTADPLPAPTAGFTFSSSAITDPLRRRMATSWRPGCPVPLEDLRYLRIGYLGFDGAVHEGEMVVHVDAVSAVERAFRRLFAKRFPIRSMRLVDDFGGSDFASIEADNTSAFNCRAVTGSSTAWSRHAYGRAIDINPIENPYVSSGGVVQHARSRAFVDRRPVRPGMIVAGDAIVAAFAAEGWGWGGYWSNPIDYQHFSADGR